MSVETRREDTLMKAVIASDIRCRLLQLMVMKEGSQCLFLEIYFITALWLIFLLTTFKARY